jgi:hypothetical protein
VASLADIIARLAQDAQKAAEAPARGVEASDPWTTWLRLPLGSWPPFPDPAPSWPRNADLETLWAVLWDAEMPAPPDPGEVLAEAEEERRLYPESIAVRQRAADPDWLQKTMNRYACYSSERAWHQIELLLRTHPGTARLSPTEQRRIAWAHKRADKIRPIVDQARSEHEARYG